ncbi:MAG: sugar transporter [Pseudomonadota bacterium]
MRTRHYGVLFSFVLCVILPLSATVYYLYEVAADQYATVFGFSVRSEETSQASALLDGLAALSGSNSSSDTDILYEYIQSPAMVQAVDAQLDLATVYSRPEFDPVFAYDPDGVFEDLVSHWERMVRVSYGTGTGLLEVRANAFTAEESFQIAQAIVAEATRMINQLSSVAREDAMRYAGEDLNSSLERLKGARQALTEFRSVTRIVDPTADISGQVGLLNSLEAQQAEAIIDMNLLIENASDTDPRVVQLRKRISVIENLIEKERAKFGLGGVGVDEDGDNYSTLVGEFERLMVDLEYAEKTYLAAQGAFDAARAVANRQNLYLATYSAPSMAQSPLYPKRMNITLLVGAALILSWLIGLLVYYSLRDRK